MTTKKSLSLQTLTTPTIASGGRLTTRQHRKGQSSIAIASFITLSTVALDSFKVDFTAQAYLASQFEELVRVAVTR